MSSRAMTSRTHNYNMAAFLFRSFVVLHCNWGCVNCEYRSFLQFLRSASRGVRQCRWLAASVICGQHIFIFLCQHIQERKNLSDLQHFGRKFVSCATHQCCVLVSCAAKYSSLKMTGSKKCSFNADWVNANVSDYASWVRRVENDLHQAICTVCCKTFLLSSMGHNSFKSCL